MQIFVSNYSCNNPLQMNCRSVLRCGLGEKNASSSIAGFQVSDSGLRGVVFLILGVGG
jgi:hypothetical protein